LESFRLAWEQGADGIEADFRLTADHRIVCMHDATTDRTTGSDLRIAETPLDELRRLDAGGGAMIPTLDEILAALPLNSWFFIEIKSGPEIIPHLKNVLHASGVSPERIRMLAFSAPHIVALKQQLPGWRSCWLCDYRHTILTGRWTPSRNEIFATLDQTAADGLASANRAILDRVVVEKLHHADKELHVWTVDDLRSARRLYDLGVTSIMTNRPGWLRQKLQELSS
jgi:glycerophosphoryl diester phosphodiesterase